MFLKNSHMIRFFASFLRFKLANKIVLGYLPLILVIILIAVFALVNLNEVNKTSDSIVKSDMLLIEIADNMVDNLLAQESYGRRYVILESKEMLELFWQRSNEFDVLVARLRMIPEQKNIPVAQLESLHMQFNNLYQEGLKHLRKPSKPLAKEYDKIIRSKLDEMISLIQKMVLDAKQNQNQKMLKTRGIGLRAFRITAILSILGIFLGVSAAYLITRNILRSIHELKLATRMISEGKFNHVTKLKSQDELGELANAFSDMAQRLARLEEMYLDANPLTRLPGNIAIENVLRKRLESGQPVAFCLIDLDDFKAFNDKYGYAMGSEIIKAVASIIETATSDNGTAYDFIGHIGGDDFVIITTPEGYEAICKSIVKEFDKKIVDFYNPKDRKKGYIVGKTRQGKRVRFPIMTVSIAVVTNDKVKPVNHIQVGEIAAELKEYAKSLPGSVIVKDRRGKTIKRESQ